MAEDRKVDPAEPVPEPGKALTPEYSDSDYMKKCIDVAKVLLEVMPAMQLLAMQQPDMSGAHVTRIMITALIMADQSCVAVYDEGFGKDGLVTFVRGAHETLDKYRMERARARKEMTDDERAASRNVQAAMDKILQDMPVDPDAPKN